MSFSRLESTLGLSRLLPRPPVVLPPSRPTSLPVGVTVPLASGVPAREALALAIAATCCLSVGPERLPTDGIVCGLSDAPNAPVSDAALFCICAMKRCSLRSRFFLAR